MFQDINFIKFNSIKNIVQLSKGWSKDQKYILEDTNGSRFLLRVSDKSLYEIKKKQFDFIKKIEELNIYCSKLIEFGYLKDERVYMIFSYLEGVDGTEALKDI